VTDSIGKPGRFNSLRIDLAWRIVAKGSGGESGIKSRYEPFFPVFPYGFVFPCVVRNWLGAGGGRSSHNELVAA
jgi:hypothetical protein